MVKVYDSLFLKLDCNKNLLIKMAYGQLTAGEFDETFTIKRILPRDMNGSLRHLSLYRPINRPNLPHTKKYFKKQKNNKKLFKNV